MGQNSFGLTGAVAARNHHRSRACDRPLRGRGALVAKFQRRAVLSLSCAKVAACRANQAVSKAAVCQHAADGQRFRHGRACAIQPIKRNAEAARRKSCRNDLIQQIAGKQHLYFIEPLSRLPRAKRNRLLKHGAFRAFKRLLSVQLIRDDLIKFRAVRPFFFFLTRYACPANQAGF